MKARKLIHRYSENVLCTWEVSFAAADRQSAMVACLFGLLAFLNFDNISPAPFERLTGEEELATATSEGHGRQWQSYLSPEGPTDQCRGSGVWGPSEPLTGPVARWMGRICDAQAGTHMGTGTCVGTLSWGKVITDYLLSSSGLGRSGSILAHSPTTPVSWLEERRFSSSSSSVKSIS
jgi:hypothetical protein